MGAEKKHVSLVVSLLLCCGASAYAATVVDVALYESGTTNDTVAVMPNSTVDVDVVLTLTGSPGTDLALAGYEMDIVDDYDFGSATKGISIASILDRAIVPTGWADLSLSVYPVQLWNTALDAAAYATNVAYELQPGLSGASYVVETLTLTAPDSFPVDGCGSDGRGYYVTVLDSSRDDDLVFTGVGGAELEIGDIAGICIYPEPGTVALLVVGGMGLLSRRRRYSR